VAAILDAGPFDIVSWDFDGVIADTEPVQRESYVRMLRARGYEPLPGFFSSLIGKNEGQIWEQLLSQHAISDSSASLRAERVQVFLDLAFETLTPSWVATSLLPELVRGGARQTIVSSGNVKVIIALLDRWGLASFFSEINGWAGQADATAKTEVLRRVVRASNRPLVIEDDVGYLRLARELQATTVGVRHSLNELDPGDADFLLDIGPAPTERDG
jgi:beta-phosphoglucomutase-like phosphatase (HAD superfamily)